MKKHYYTNEILSICDNHHLTVDEIFEKIQKKFPEAGKSSIYRNVEQLAEKGELKKVFGLGKKTLFEKTKEDHAHFICKNSGKVFDISLSGFSLPQMPENFTGESLDLKIYGKVSS